MACTTRTCTSRASHAPCRPYHYIPQDGHCPCPTPPHTWLANLFHTCSMNGTCFTQWAKSRPMRYSSRVLPVDEGMHACSWKRCCEQFCDWEAASSWPGFTSPMVDTTMQGGRNSMAMGYGSQCPARGTAAEGVLKRTRLEEGGGRGRKGGRRGQERAEDKGRSGMRAHTPSRCAKGAAPALQR